MGKYGGTKGRAWHGPPSVLGSADVKVAPGGRGANVEVSAGMSMW